MRRAKASVPYRGQRCQYPFVRWLYNLQGRCDEGKQNTRDEVKNSGQFYFIINLTFPYGSFYDAVSSSEYKASD